MTETPYLEPVFAPDDARNHKHDLGLDDDVWHYPLAADGDGTGHGTVSRPAPDQRYCTFVVEGSIPLCTRVVYRDPGAAAPEKSECTWHVHAITWCDPSKRTTVVCSRNPGDTTLWRRRD